MRDETTTSKLGYAITNLALNIKKIHMDMILCVRNEKLLP